MIQNGNNITNSLSSFSNPTPNIKQGKNSIIILLFCYVLIRPMRNRFVLLSRLRILLLMDLSPSHGEKKTPALVQPATASRCIQMILAKEFSTKTRVCVLIVLMVKKSFSLN